MGLCLAGQHGGEALKEARKRAKLSQAELADKIGRQQPAVSKWERGQKTPPDEIKVLLAEVLDVPIVELFPWLAPRRIEASA